MSYAEQHLRETSEIVSQLDPGPVERAVALLLKVRTQNGRLFVLGVGGSAANASHAVNDFRKIAGMECYAPTDNVSELTARTRRRVGQRLRRMAQGQRLSEKDVTRPLRRRR